MLSGVRELRNMAAHRTLSADPRKTDREVLGKRVGFAKRFVEIMGDRKMARRIEEVVQGWWRR